MSMCPIDSESLNLEHIVLNIPKLVEIKYFDLIRNPDLPQNMPFHTLCVSLVPPNFGLV